MLTRRLEHGDDLIGDGFRIFVPEANRSVHVARVERQIREQI